MTGLPISSLQGVNVAAITPRGKDGDLNFGATFDLIDYLSAARVGAIALFTAFGEYPALAVDDRARFTYLAVKRSRVPVLAGVGSATLDHSIDLAREARSAGVAAVFVPPPLQYHCDRDDLLEFYAQFARQVGSGVAIIPGGDLPAGTAATLLESENFAGVADENSDLEALDTLRARSPGKLVLATDDRLLVPARTAGFGVLSGAACAAPELTMALDSTICAGHGEKVDRLEALHRELLAWLEKFPLPAGVKSAVALRGIQTGPLAVPLSSAKQECLERFREWFRAWLPASRKLSAHG